MEFFQLIKPNRKFEKKSSGEFNIDRGDKINKNNEDDEFNNEFKEKLMIGDVFKKSQNKLIKCFRLKKKAGREFYKVIWIYFSGWKKEEILSLDEIFERCVKENIPFDNYFKFLFKNYNKRVVDELWNHYEYSKYLKSLEEDS